MMKNLVAGIALLLFAAVMVVYVLAGETSAQGPVTPAFPHIFLGNVTVDGLPAAPDLLIEARIGNVNYAQSVHLGLITQPVTESGGTYGLEIQSQVCGDFPSTPNEKEGGVSGVDVIDFFVHDGTDWFLAQTSSPEPIEFEGAEGVRTTPFL